MPDPNLNRLELGERLRQAREYLELSQDEVAKKLGISRSAVSLIESAQRKVDAIELRMFAQLYQRPVSYFTGETVSTPLPEDIEHLARTAKKLSTRDRKELARFAEFLSSRAASRGQSER